MTKETAFLFGDGTYSLLIVAASLEEARKAAPPGYVYSGITFQNVHIVGAWRFA